MLSFARSEILTANPILGAVVLGTILLSTVTLVAFKK